MRQGIKTIAEMAGVSVATVSLALKNDKRISGKTREKIKKLAERIGYIPNNFGIALQANRSSLIGFLASTVTSSYFNEILEGCVRVASAKGYGIITAIPSQFPQEHIAMLRMFMEKRVDGIILAAYHRDIVGEICKINKTFGVPVVLCSLSQAFGGIPIVKNDDYMTGKIAAEHLISLGHKKLIFCYAENYQHNERAKGAYECCKKYKVEYTVVCDENMLKQILKFGSPPTGIIAHFDGIAIDILHFLRDLGFRVPEEISVIGVDDAPYASLQAYNLTTIAPQKRKIGEIAFEMILKKFRGKEIKSVFLSPDLIIRGTTASPI